MAKRAEGTKRLARRAGRPPAGPNGEPVSDSAREALGLRPLVPFSVRVPEEFTSRIDAAKIITRKPLWQILIDGIDAYIAAQPTPIRQAIEAAAAVTPPRHRKSRR